MKQRPIGVGIVGYGLAGRVFHSTLIRNVEEFAIRAIAVRNEGRRAQAVLDHPEATIHASASELFANTDVDLVVIATPHDTHASLCIEAAQMGKHVVVDKIMCMNVSEGEAMIAAAETNGVHLSVFQNRRWDADFLTVQDVIARGLVGEPFVIESSVTGFGLTPGYRLPAGDRPRGWRTYAEFGGGPFRDWGAHLLDQAVQLCGGSPRRVIADFQYRRDWDVETAGTATLVFGSDDGTNRDGVRFVIEVGNISAIPKPRWLIRGSEGAYIQHGRDPQEQALHRGDVGPRKMLPEHSPRLVREIDGALQDVELDGLEGNYLAYYQNVAGAIRGRERLMVTASSVLQSVRLLEAAAESARTNQVIAL